MTTITTFIEANGAILDSFAAERAANADAELIGFLDEILSRVPLIMPERVSDYVELIYARAETATATSKSVAADVCDYATQNGWYGLADDERGALISAALRGETVETPPEALEKYVPVVPEPEPDPAP